MRICQPSSIRSELRNFAQVPHSPYLLPPLPVASTLWLTRLQVRSIQNFKDRLTIEEAKVHPWVTEEGAVTLASTNENCHLVEVSEAEVANAVTCIRWGTMVSQGGCVGHHGQ